MFSSIKLVRGIVMGMLTILPLYAHVMTLLLVLFYMFAVVGCWLFAGQFAYVNSYDMPMANFDSFIDALLTLYQLLIGEAWDGVMETAVAADSSRFGLIT